jgi:hypothetical protein
MEVLVITHYDNENFTGGEVYSEISVDGNNIIGIMDLDDIEVFIEGLKYANDVNGVKTEITYRKMAGR